MGMTRQRLIDLTEVGLAYTRGAFKYLYLAKLLLGDDPRYKSLIADLEEILRKREKSFNLLFSEAKRLKQDMAYENFRKERKAANEERRKARGLKKSSRPLYFGPYSVLEKLEKENK